MKFLKAQGGEIIFNEEWDDFKCYRMFLKELESLKILKYSALSILMVR